MQTPRRRKRPRLSAAVRLLFWPGAAACVLFLAARSGIFFRQPPAAPVVASGSISIPAAPDPEPGAPSSQPAPPSSSEPQPPPSSSEPPSSQPVQPSSPAPVPPSAPSSEPEPTPEPAPEPEPESEPAPEPESPPDPSVFPQTIHSRNALLIDAETGEVLFEKNAQDIVYPASLTKIMTVLIAIESLPDLDAGYTLSPALFEPLYRDNAALAGFAEGETVPLRDLLYAAMLPSGAEAAVGLAVASAGSEELFVERMNLRAQELGMLHTHFTNPVGLHNARHCSTAEDMAILLRYALKNPTFRTVFTTHSYRSAITPEHPQGLVLGSTTFSRLESPVFPGGELLGAKTGFTNMAGLCLASLAVKDSGEYLLVTMGAPGNHAGPQYHLIDAINIYSCAF